MPQIDTRLFYISNCIKRILDAPCSNRNLNKRAEEIAQAVEWAAAEGLDVAHDYLVNLSRSAEEGRYASE